MTWNALNELKWTSSSWLNSAGASEIDLLFSEVWPSQHLTTYI